LNIYEHLIPTNKFDTDKIEQLAKVDRTDIVPLLPQLMEWIQDMNWPVATPVLELLVTFPEEVVPLIKDVIATDDGNWKYWCLRDLVPRLPLDSQKLLSDELLKLAHYPTKDDKAEELDEIAGEILLTINKSK
jgi:hypothetical protein